MARVNLFSRIVGSLRSSDERGETNRVTLHEIGRVVPDPRRCVQCGVCSYNCPIGIPVREYARQGLPVQHSDCITCGQCIQVCPRGTLRWETLSHSLVADDWTGPNGNHGMQLSPADVRDASEKG